MRYILALCVALSFIACSSGKEFESERLYLDLAGKWSSSLCECLLPGTTDENRLGDGVHPTDITSRLTRTYPYAGVVEYTRQVHISSDMAARRMVLNMERTKPSTLFIDGDSIGSLGHIYAPHRYLLPQLEEGEHEIRIRIDNSETSVPAEIQGSHAWTDNTQTNWNGILGDFHIEATPYTFIESMQIYPSVADRAATIKLRIESSAEQSAMLNIDSHSWNSRQKHTLEGVEQPLELHRGTNEVEITLDLGEEMLLWSEFHPALYAVDCRLTSADGVDNVVDNFGVRDFSTSGTQFTINGYKTFLRGKHDACVFPLTGYAPMDVESWRKVFRIAKSYGINYYRCHSYTPPKAAFEAADIEGIYFQTELPLWGTITEQTKPLNEFLLREARMILDFLGNHASFTMLGLGNELNGDVAVMRRWLDEFRSRDSRHLYSYGSNNFLGWQGPQDGEDYLTTCRVGGSEGYESHVRSSFAFVDAEQGGILNNTRPNTRADYSQAIARSPRPVISHETGQFQIYPDYDEIAKYTGVLHPYNLEIFRRRLRENGLQDQAEAFHEATGRFAVECYKADIEYGLRTRGLGGFQMLDLQDFPGQGSALVGMLNAFMESKGITTPEEFRSFCAPVVPLALIDDFCLDGASGFVADVALANYVESDWTEPVDWTLKSVKGSHFSAEGRIEAAVEQGDVATVGRISLPLTSIHKPTQLRLTLSTDDYSNYYNLWVYPSSEEPEHEEIHICAALDTEARSLLAEGGRVLLVPDHKAIEQQSVGGLFTPDYWNYAMFKSISENAGKEVSPGTLSLLMDSKHPLFEDFPTDDHSNWQWWSIVRNARPLVLNATRHEYKPLIQVVDNVERNHKLGLLFEFKVGEGRVLVCMSDLEAVAQTPEGAQFRRSILDYMLSDEFAPTEQLSAEELSQLLSAEVSQREIIGEKNLSDYDVQ